MTGAPKGKLPEGGDVVSCWFPYDEKPDERGGKLRPALVVTAESDINGQFLRVAYPTGQRTPDKNAAPLPPHCFTVDPRGGLTQQTVFDFSRVLRLPFTDKWFEPWSGVPTILLCKLTPDQLPSARSARLAGEATTAARLATKAANTKAAAAPVTVTIKQPKRIVQVPRKNPTAEGRNDGQ